MQISWILSHTDILLFQDFDVMKNKIHLATFHSLYYVSDTVFCSAVSLFNAFIYLYICITFILSKQICFNLLYLPDSMRWILWI